jgi:hypothetical protein
MSVRKKVDPSLAAQSINISSAKPKATRVKKAPVEEAPAVVKARHETSVRFSPETRVALDEILAACQEAPELQHRIIQKTAFEMGLYVLSQLDSDEFKSACLSMPNLSTANGGAPLRIPMAFYSEIVVPLIDTYSDVMKSRKGANVSRLTIIGLHNLHNHLVKDKAGFVDMLSKACDQQHDDKWYIC